MPSSRRASAPASRPTTSRSSPGSTRGASGSRWPRSTAATHAAGDADEPFSIQSISKVFLLTLALGRHGEGLWTHVGREPSGSAFNSIVQLEHEQGRPRNPFINPGAIVVTDLVLAGHTPREAIGEILRFLRSLADDETIGDRPGGRALRGGDRRAQPCAGAVHALLRPADPSGRQGARGLLPPLRRGDELPPARARRPVPRGGRPGPDDRQLGGRPARARRINALMLTCGLYDASGDFAYRVGLPAKSGVGGGILAVAPGHASICVWSPGLDQAGNSLLGVAGAGAAGAAHRLVGVRGVTRAVSRVRVASKCLKSLQGTTAINLNATIVNGVRRGPPRCRRGSRPRARGRGRGPGARGCGRRSRRRQGCRRRARAPTW